MMVKKMPFWRWTTLGILAAWAASCRVSNGSDAAGAAALAAALDAGQNNPLSHGPAASLSGADANQPDPSSAASSQPTSTQPTSGAGASGWAGEYDGSVDKTALPTSVDYPDCLEVCNTPLALDVLIAGIDAPECSGLVAIVQGQGYCATVDDVNRTFVWTQEQTVPEAGCTTTYTTSYLLSKAGPSNFDVFQAGIVESNCAATTPKCGCSWQGTLSFAALFSSPRATPPSTVPIVSAKIRRAAEGAPDAPPFWISTPGHVSPP